VIVRFFMPLSEANGLPHRFVLEADDDPDDDDDDSPLFRMERTLKSDARTLFRDDSEAPPEDGEPSAPFQMAEIHFEHVPDAGSYRLRVDDVDSPYSVFVRRPFHLISELSAELGVIRFPRLFDIINASEPDPAEPQPADQPAEAE
jgi:hypothetical protein